MARPGAGPRHLASWPAGGPPLVSKRCPLMAFYLETLNINFLEFSGKLHYREFFKVQKAAKTFVNLRQMLEQVKLQTQKVGYSKENKQ